ncbi:MAG: SDR family NAD(P)-dependent oxidoreductase [Xanthobacteraceae bacterium]
MTGATSGLGLACARALLQRTAPPWRLVIASRNPAEGERVAAELNRQSGRQAVEFMRLDLGSLGSVRAVGAALRSRGLRLDALVCNAGLQFTREMRTADGLEASFGVNHLGHFALLDGIKGLLAADARIVVVSSGTHDPRQKAGIPVPRFVDPVLLARPERDASHGFEQDDKPRVVMQRRYSTSKLCNLYFAYELNRRIQDGRFGVAKTVTVNAFDPGLMPGSGLARDYPLPLRLVWHHVLPHALPLLRRFVSENIHTPDASGRALAEMVDGDGWSGVSGRYAAGRDITRRRRSPTTRPRPAACGRSANPCWARSRPMRYRRRAPPSTRGDGAATPARPRRRSGLLLDRLLDRFLGGGHLRGLAHRSRVVPLRGIILRRPRNFPSPAGPRSAASSKPRQFTAVNAEKSAPSSSSTASDGNGRSATIPRFSLCRISCSRI